MNQVASYRNGKGHENSIENDGKYIVVNSKFVSTDGEVIKRSNKQIEPLYKNELAFVLSDVPNGRAIARTFLVKKDGIYTLNQRISGITPFKNTYPYFLHIIMNRNKYFWHLMMVLNKQIYQLMTYLASKQITQNMKSKKRLVWSLNH